MGSRQGQFSRQHEAKLSLHIAKKLHREGNSYKKEQVKESLYKQSSVGRVPPKMRVCNKESSHGKDCVYV